MKKNLLKKGIFYRKNPWKISIYLMLTVFFVGIFFLLSTSPILDINDIDVNIKHHDTSLDNDEFKFTYGNSFHLSFLKNYSHANLFNSLPWEINTRDLIKSHTIFYSFSKSNIDRDKFQPWTRSTFS